MSHETVRVLIIPETICLISEKGTLDKFSTSATGISYADDRTGLYGQSALYVFGLFCEDMKKNNYNYYDLYNNRCPALFEVGRFYYL